MIKIFTMANSKYLSSGTCGGSGQKSRGMGNKLVKVHLAFLFLLFFMMTSASAGPIFHLMSASNSGSYAHPSGGGNMVWSNTWGVTSTGAGFMDGRITFVDGFALPSAPGSVAFDENDIAEFSFDHSQPTGLSGSPFPAPIFGFTALASDIVSASGNIQFNGTDYIINNMGGAPTITTTVESTILDYFGTPGLTGEWQMDAANILTLQGTGSDLGSSVSLTASTLGGGGTFYKLTGFTTTPVPEPTTVALLGIGLAWLAGAEVRRRRKKSVDKS